MIFRCTNCMWEGSVEDMATNSFEYWCPNCLASFYPEDGEDVGPWEVIEIPDEDDEDTDYGEFDL